MKIRSLLSEIDLDEAEKYWKEAAHSRDQECQLTSRVEMEKIERKNMKINNTYQTVM